MSDISDIFTNQRHIVRFIRHFSFFASLASSKEETLREGGHRIDDWLFARMKDEWQDGMSA